ncbi:hypothetical protein NG799_06790 [Laspinema sp. D1]|uniref:Uncharacterized protein n=1 Tax=Laspinema palackyanum D2a TaxID=2953684 RepID=A0ABT2MMT8_9CYAN|nr:hypothetical protein [Laspinema sp. D2a]
MRPDLENAIVTESELETIAGVDVNDIGLSLAFRLSFLQNLNKLLSFAIAQLFILVLFFILLTPLGILMVRNSGLSGQEMATTVYFLLFTAGIAGVATLILNWYLWRRSQKFQTFLTLLDEIQKYNEVVRSLDILDKIEAAGAQIQLSDRQEVLEALNITRESLLGSLRTDRILRENQDLIDHRYELFAKIENNLATLNHLKISDEATEYGRLLNQALKIGVSVDREIRRIQNRTLN